MDDAKRKVIEFIGWTVFVLISVYAYFWVGFFLFVLIDGFEPGTSSYRESCRKEPGYLWFLVFWPIIGVFAFFVYVLP